MRATRQPTSIEGPAATPASALDQVLDAERVAAESLARAEAEAGTIIEQARIDRAAADALMEAALAQELAAMTSGAAIERENAVAAIEAGAATAASRYDGCRDDTIRGIAARLLAALAEPEADR